MSKPINNERKACDAVVRVLEQLSGGTRANARSPEDMGHTAPVEYAFDLIGRDFAVEHTVVEAFGGQIQSDVDFAAFEAPISAALDRAMPPPGKFVLAFAIDPTRGMSRKAIARAQAAIVAWVRSSAADLHAEHPDEPKRATLPRGHTGMRKSVIEGVEVTLVRETLEGMPRAATGRLFVQRFAPPGYDALRVDRLRKALATKLPKLANWKADGARTILVLENRDLALTSPGSVYDALEAALISRSDPPDEVWLVEVVDHPWTAWCLLRDRIAFPDEDTDHRWYDFDPAKLNEF